MHAMATTTRQPVQVTDAELRQAFTLCRARSWPDTFEEAMADETRKRLITACAHGLHNKAARQAQAAQGTPLPQQPLVQHWPPRRATPAMFDLKRAAAGDRDED